MKIILKVILTFSFILLLSSNPSDNQSVKDSITKIDDANLIHLFNNQEPGPK